MNHNYQYKMIRCTVDRDLIRFGQNKLRHELITDYLNELGAEGWRVFTFETSDNLMYFHALLMRTEHTLAEVTDVCAE